MKDLTQEELELVMGGVKSRQPSIIVDDGAPI